jgi:hypothetical protein
VSPDFLPPDPYADQQAPPPAGGFLPPTAPPRQSKRATRALALGTAGLGVLFFTGGTLFFLALPASIAGWVLGNQARREGAEQANVAVIVGITGVGFGVVAGAVWILVAALGEA